MRWLSIGALAVVLAACSHTGVVVQRDSAGDRLGQYHRIGVLTFKDGKGQGEQIAEGIQAGLEKLLYESADRAALKRLAVEYKLEPNSGIRLEAVESFRDQAGADALIMGVMAPDWSAISMTVAEMEMGEPVLRITVTPRDPKQKTFASADEVVQAALRALADQR